MLFAARQPSQDVYQTHLSLDFQEFSAKTQLFLRIQSATIQISQAL